MLTHCCHSGFQGSTSVTWCGMTFPSLIPPSPALSRVCQPQSSIMTRLSWQDTAWEMPAWKKRQSLSLMEQMLGQVGGTTRDNGPWWFISNRGIEEGSQLVSNRLSDMLRLYCLPIYENQNKNWFEEGTINYYLSFADLSINKARHIT